MRFFLEIYLALGYLIILVAWRLTIDIYGLNAHLSNTTKVPQARVMPGYLPLRSTLR